nr:immunoglobulin heavy chain junction region [Mus musculus]
CARTASSDYW